MNKDEKRKVRMEIINLLDNHCKGCNLIPHKHSNSKKHEKWCQNNCDIGYRLKTLGDSLDEGRTESMGEERNWDKICKKAEKLRAEDKQKWTWKKIADHLGVNYKTFYAQVSKRRELEEMSEFLSNSPKRQVVTKPLVNNETAKLPKNEASDKAKGDVDMLAEFKARVLELVEENAQLQKELLKVNELIESNEQLAKELLAETKVRMRVEDSFSFLQKQYFDLEEDHSCLQKEHEESVGKWFEQLEEIKMLREELSKERKHRLETQGKFNALGTALKAVL